MERLRRRSQLHQARPWAGGMTHGTFVLGLTPEGNAEHPPDDAD